MLSFKSLTFYTLLFSILLVVNLLAILLDPRVVESLWRRLYRYLYPLVIVIILFLESKSMIIPFAGVIFLISSIILVLISREIIYLPRIKKDKFEQTLFPILEGLKESCGVETNQNTLILDNTVKVTLDINDRSIKLNPSTDKYRSLVLYHIKKGRDAIKTVRRKQVAETGILTGIFCGIIIFYTVVVQNGRILY